MHGGGLGALENGLEADGLHPLVDVYLELLHKERGRESRRDRGWECSWE